MLKFLFTFIILQCLIVDVLSLYCYICSNCDDNSNYTLTSQLVGTTNDFSCYKLSSVLPDYSQIIIRGYTENKCSSSQITDTWGFKQGSCCTTDYCNSTNTINTSILTFLFYFFIIINFYF